MKISYNEATAKDCSTLEKDLVLCEKAGFDYIEIRLDMLREYLKNHTVRDLKNFFSSSHLKPHALNALYTYEELFTESDKGSDKEKEIINEFLTGCMIGQEIGAEYFVIVPPLQRNPDGGPYVGKRDQITKDCIRILKKLSFMAEPYNMKLGFELVGFERSSVRDINHINEIIEGAGRDNIGFTIDAFNLYLNNELNDFSILESIDSSKIFVVHINNGDNTPVNMLSQANRTFCGNGCIDLENYLTVLKKIGYNGMVSIETFRPEYWEKTPEWVIEEAYKTTRSVMETYNVLN